MSSDLLDEAKRVLNGGTPKPHATDATFERMFDIMHGARREVRNGIAVSHTLETPEYAELGCLHIDLRYEFERLHREIEQLRREKGAPDEQA